jgi:DNA-binding CsgD family transcriptional regulator
LQLTELVVSAAFLLLIILMPEKTPLLNSLLFSLVIATLLHSTLFLVIFGSPGFDRHSRGLSLAALCLFVLFAAVYGTVFALSRGMPGLVSAYIFDVFFTTEMLIMLIITEKSFDHPLYLQDGNLSEYFLTTFDLSRRESEIIEKLLCEMDNKSIAYDLGLSVRTVENHLYSIYKKTGTASRGQLIRLLYSAGDPSLR